MGILNLTPDSFSDGGKFNKKNKSFSHIIEMIKAGAEIIDVGGESTRPGSKTISPKTEWNRLNHVLKNFKKDLKILAFFRYTKVWFDDKRSKSWVDLINDVSGFRFDPKSLTKLKYYKIAKVLHHMQGLPSTMQKNPKYQMYY